MIAASALIADVLSTGFFVLGPERGLEVSARLRREGVPQEALYLVDDWRGRLRLSLSRGRQRLASHVTRRTRNGWAGVRVAA